MHTRLTKRPVADGSDGRRHYRLDEIRTSAWVNFIKEQTAKETAYGLNECLGEGHQKWADYIAGKRVPNQATLDSIDDLVPGSRDVFMSGPAGMKLWPALESDDHQCLWLIAKRANRTDGEIARLRLEAEAFSIPVQYVPPPGFFEPDNLDELSPLIWFNEETFDDFYCGVGIIRLSLQSQNLLSDQCCDQVVNYLVDKLRPYRIAAYRRAFEQFDDSFNSGSVTFERIRDADEEMIFQSLEARSIRNKGAK